MITFSKTLLITWEPVCPLAARNCAVVSNQKCMFRPSQLPPLMHIAQVRYTAADWHKPPVAKKGSKGSQSHIDPIRSGVRFQIWCRISNLVQDFKSDAGLANQKCMLSLALLPSLMHTCSCLHQPTVDKKGIQGETVPANHTLDSIKSGIG